MASTTSFFRGAAEGRGKTADLSGLMENHELPAAVRKHLTRVYATLALAVAAAAAGALAHMRYNAGGTLSSLATLGMVMWLAADQDKRDYSRRTAMLCAMAFFKGLSIGPLVAHAAFVDPALIVTAFTGTAAVFACFTASALVARRQAYLALGGLLGSGLSLMAMLSLANLFFRSVAIFQFHLYFGLLLFSGYVVYDTQLVVERAAAGDRDYVWHAMELFIDFVAVFVRVLIILLQNADKKKEKRSSSRRR